MRFRSVFHSILVAAITVVTVGAVVFVVLPRTSAVTVLMAPGIPLAGALGRFVPSSFFSLIGENGPRAFLFLVCVFAFFFWTALVAALYFFWRRLRGTHAA